MKQATIRSVCECQSELEAVLDEHRFVLAGFAIGSDRVRERSPAHTIEAAHRRFDVGWLCPVCGRNTLRSFDADALSWIDADPPAPAAFPPPQPPPPLGPGPATGFAVPPRGPASPSIRAASASPPAASVPPNASTAVALKSLSTPPRPPSTPPPRPASAPPPAKSTPPEPDKTS
jgi:hypothetical protein